MAAQYSTIQTLQQPNAHLKHQSSNQSVSMTIQGKTNNSSFIHPSSSSSIIKNKSVHIPSQPAQGKEMQQIRYEMLPLNQRISKIPPKAQKEDRPNTMQVQNNHHLEDELNDNNDIINAHFKSPTQDNKTSSHNNKSMTKTTLATSKKTSNSNLKLTPSFQSSKNIYQLSQSRNVEPTPINSSFTGKRKLFNVAEKHWGAET